MATPASRYPLSRELSGSDQVDLWAIVLGLWSTKRLIIAGTIAGVLAAGVISKLLPRTYEAMATVLVTPATFTSALQAPPLSIESYARLAESEFVKGLVRNRLAEQHVNPAQMGELRAVLYSSKEPSKPYLPVLGLTADARTADASQRIANLWAMVLLAEQERLSSLTSDTSVDFVLSEYPKALKNVEETEGKLQAMRARHAQELAQVRIRVGVDPPPERNDNAVETIIVGGPQQQTGPKQVAADAQQKLALDLQAQVRQMRVQVEQEKTRVAQLEAELENVPTGSRQDAPITSQLAAERVRYATDMATLDALTREGIDADTTASRTRTQLVDGQRAIAELQRRQDAEEFTLQQALDEANARLKPLREKIGDAQLAKNQRNPDLRIGALATVPLSPIRPNLIINLLAGGALGLLISLAGAWVMLRYRRSASGVPLV